MKKLVITFAVLFASVTGAFAQYYYPNTYYYYDAWRGVREPYPPVVYYVEPYRYQYRHYHYELEPYRRYDNCALGVVLGDLCIGFQSRW